MTSSALARTSDSEMAISRQEFSGFAVRLASHIDLFRDLWAQDSDAELYGGTVRDYLFWLRSQLRSARTHADAEQIMNKLLARRVVKAREFLFADSDVDALSDKNFSLDPLEYGIRAIDIKSKEVTNPNTASGRDEHLQGYIPIEKLRLSQTDILETPGLDGGLGEVYANRPTLKLSSPQDFANSARAKNFTNHPILLVLRYLRVLALGYYRDYGAGYPDLDLILSKIDPQTEAQIRQTIADIKKPRALQKHMEQARFVRWFNATIQKSFRAYTNPTAAMLLMQHFGLTDLQNYYPQVESMNQFLFAKHWDGMAREKALAQFRLREEQLYSPVAKEFADGFLYHGTGSEEAFRNILIEGILPSKNGLVGPGLYGVAKEEMMIAEDFAQAKERLISFRVKPDARIIDIGQGEGLRAWKQFSAKFGEEQFARFAEIFNADILRYDYRGAHAYVVTNSMVLSHGNGVFRPILPLSELFERLDTIQDAVELIVLIELNGLSRKDSATVWQNSKFTPSDLLRQLQDPAQLQRVFEMKSEVLNRRVLETLGPLRDLSFDVKLMFFDQLIEARDEQSANLLGALIVNLGSQLDAARKQKVLTYIMDPSLRTRRGLKDLPGFVGSISSFVTDHTDEKFKLTLLKYLHSTGTLGHIWLHESKFESMVVTSVEAQKEMSEFLFSAAQESGAGIRAIRMYGAAGRYPLLLAKIRNAFVSGTPAERKAALGFVEFNVSDEATVSALLEALNLDPSLRLTGLKALTAHGADFKTNALGQQILWSLAHDRDYDVRTAALSALRQSLPSSWVRSETLADLVSRVTSSLKVRTLQGHVQKFDARSVESEEAIKLIIALANKGSAEAESAALRLLINSNLAPSDSHMLNFRLQIRQETSYALIAQLLRDPARGFMLDYFVENHIKYYANEAAIKNRLLVILQASRAQSHKHQSSSCALLLDGTRG